MWLPLWGKKMITRILVKRTAYSAVPAVIMMIVSTMGLGGGWTGSWGGRYVPTEKVSLKTGIERDTHVEYGKCQHIS